jgi:hypothetical protein
VSITFTPDVVDLPDTKPETDDNVRPPDATDEAPYGYTKTGRIRKRPIGSRAGGGPSANASNEKLAAQAAEALSQIHDLMAAGSYVMGFRDTPRKITDANDAFKDRAAAALVNDPKLCRSILRGGESAGKMGLVVAYVMFAASIAPVAMSEAKEMRAARAEMTE